MESVVVISTLRLREDKTDEARKVIESLVARTHEYEGCLTFAAHEDAADALTLVLVEHWASQEAVDAHSQAPYLAEAMGRVGELLSAEPEIRFLTPLGYGTADKAKLR
ncbi:putative quinol monooxygenase [Streptomyces sp. NPDC051286]|uniref:putative quinol monooxygenase n=1 Tax=Streptomyces sp. NPDC051286 TaxID=3365647 RepID=UPI0037BC6407